MWLVIAGLVAGAAIAMFATRLMAKLLFNTPPTDITTFGAVAATLAAVTVAACWVPARRALKVDPVQALRAR
jgi:ABC-type antimicrobial peptide transport system permease subunit